VVVGTDAPNVPCDYPTNLRVSGRETGLPKDTVFLCFQLRSLDPNRFLDPCTGMPMLVGVLPTARPAELDEALRLVLRAVGSEAGTDPGRIQNREESDTKARSQHRKMTRSGRISPIFKDWS